MLIFNVNYDLNGDATEIVHQGVQAAELLLLRMHPGSAPLPISFVTTE